ncbi:hypothetical protein [Actinoplanes sp. NPDC049265]|uniref:hypothetical protein n=1 Tax=Actinoplanes sp. NPDC049265 TaxID=3363902 RepID=UPI00371E774A
MTSQELENIPDTEVLSVPSAAPVFVDESGRRRKLLRRVAYGFGALCMAYGGLVSVSLAGGPVSSSAVLPLPDLGRDDDRPADAAPIPPVPALTTPPASQPPRLITESLRRPYTPANGGPRRAEASRASRRPSESGKAPVRVTPTPATTKRPTESGTVSPAPTKTTPISPGPATTTPVPDPTTTPPPPVPPKPPATGGQGGGGEVDGSGAGTFRPPVHTQKPAVSHVPSTPPAPSEPDREDQEEVAE